MIKHVTKLFLSWHEGKISGQENSLIERHLEQCDSCRNYYKKMSRVFNDNSLLALGELQPDPYLPNRIESLLNESERIPNRRFYPALRWSIAGIGAVLAVIIGVYIGNDLSVSQPASLTVNDMSDYYSVIAQHGSVDRMNYNDEPVRGVQQ